MIKREIEKSEDGSYYSNKVTLQYNDANGVKTLYYIDPNALYYQVNKYMVSLSGTTVEETGDKELDDLKKRMVAIMRASIKALLVVWGNSLLTLLYGTKDHESVPKKVDIVDWYMDQFTKISIAHMMKNDIVLHGETTYSDTNKCVVSVHRCLTRPVTEKQKDE